MIETGKHQEIYYIGEGLALGESWIEACGPEPQRVLLRWRLGYRESTVRCLLSAIFRAKMIFKCLFSPNKYFFDFRNITQTITMYVVSTIYKLRPTVYGCVRIFSICVYPLSRWTGNPTDSILGVNVIKTITLQQFYQSRLKSTLCYFGKKLLDKLGRLIEELNSTAQIRFDRLQSCFWLYRENLVTLPTFTNWGQH